MKVEIEDIPKNHSKYIVAHIECGRLVYYGSSPYLDAAEEIAKNVNGIFIEEK